MFLNVVKNLEHASFKSPTRMEFVLPTGASQTTRLHLSIGSKAKKPFSSRTKLSAGQLQATAAFEAEVMNT